MGAISLGVDLEPVPDIPALVARGTGTHVIVADLHLGIEFALRRSGFTIPSQAPRMLDTLRSLSDRGERLVILGDVKHRIPTLGRREDTEIRRFLEGALESFKGVTVVAGNHDPGIGPALPPGVEALSPQGTRVEDIGLVHGHVWPSEEVMAAKTLVMAHIHPAVVFVDSIGTRTSEKCWLRARLRRKKVKERYGVCPSGVVVVPAFNPLLTGTPVNIQGGTMLGPLFRNDLVDRSTYRVYLLDGTNIGRPRVHAEKRRRRRLR